MAIAIERIHPDFGARVTGVDLAAPIDAATFGAIFDAFNEYSVLVFPGQALTDAQQIAFSQRFGPLEQTITSIANNPNVPREIAFLANIDPDGNLIDPNDKRMIYHSANQMWHTDSSFKRVPALASMLSGREVPPEGGQTEFASMRVTWERLPPDMRRFLEGKIAVHSFAYSRGLVSKGLLRPEDEAQVPPVEQVLVRTNPVNGRKSVYVASHASHIVGMPVDEGRAIIRSLIDLTTEPARVYSHQWAVGDLVMWDNRCMLHRGRPWDGTKFRRVMHRTTVAGVGPTVPNELPKELEAAAAR
ncbi:MAG TPA: TauD/TfdA family dioxygenase [Terriglobales bacterium]|nr:TauD/TfdA family dioxygenase [Terriglobales bacterium]